MFTPDQLRHHLKGTIPILKDPGGKRHAAVAMILRFYEDIPEVLLIERAVNDNDLWSGHLAMPGGRVEPIDATPRAAAHRETYEEIGVQLYDSHYLGQLSDVKADGIPMIISCYVYFLSGSFEFQLDPKEVADVFWFPLTDLHDPAKATAIRKRVPDGHKTFPAISVTGKSQPLWGITYRLLQDLARHF